ncbi:2-hydroxychromene-2-carboxylate isomerase [Acinetobacter sp. 194]|uniref:2-hydroxychromene-2-carboxylate isomerase n=1 Tax=Acinetobacter shaoyimingii TaxID=2715164 RepID=UPI001407FFEC|nr:2-hydroxychromene-2-carboxylate isomerase [Acinetobacter shaoyimingii]NHB57288.1 2-hydroxychromene-2-carboxylate isomerase [Acinetobacter shaoyimingii]
MNMIEFYFDLGSPFSYLGFYQLQKIAEKHHAEIIYKPMLLGGVFKATGNSSPIMIPAKGQYSMIDLQRWSEFWNIPMKMNPNFPINTLPLMRLVTAVQLFLPERFMEILTGIFNAMFRTPRNLNDQKDLIQVLDELGLEASQVRTWLEDEKVKSELKFVTDEAVERGVFGAPSFFVKDELFWGIDHLHFVEMALE